MANNYKLDDKTLWRDLNDAERFAQWQIDRIYEPKLYQDPLKPLDELDQMIETEAKLRRDFEEQRILSKLAEYKQQRIKGSTITPFTELTPK